MHLFIARLESGIVRASKKATRCGVALGAKFDRLIGLPFILHSGDILLNRMPQVDRGFVLLVSSAHAFFLSEDVMETRESSGSFLVRGKLP
jgi:hypothetical protein